MKKILPLFICVICLTLNIHAEDSIVHRNITVEREYKPMIQPAGKINAMPKVLEVIIQKSTPKYSDFNLPLTVDYNIHQLPAAALKLENQSKTQHSNAVLGIGNYYNTLADIYIPLMNKKDFHLDFSLNHLGTFSSKAHSNTHAALAFDMLLDKVNLFAGINGKHEYFKYYGDNFNSDLGVVNMKTTATIYPNINFNEKNWIGYSNNPHSNSLLEIANEPANETFWRFNAFAGVRSIPSSDTDLKYEAKVDYQLFQSLSGYTENTIHSLGKINWKYDKYRIGVDIDMNNMMYYSEPTKRIPFKSSYTVLLLNPFYAIERESWNLHLGIKSSFSLGYGKVINPSADVRGEWKAIPELLAVYGGVTGGYDINTMTKTFNENRFLSSDLRIEDTYTPYNIYLGLKLKPLDNILLDAFIDYRQINNQYYFVNKSYSASSQAPTDSLLYTNRFNVLYTHTTLTRMGICLGYNLKNSWNAQIKGTYNLWNAYKQEYAWNKPKWEVSLNTDLRITPAFKVNASAYYEGERYAMLGNKAIRMSPKVDINLGVSYIYTNWLTAFARINNLLNSSYQEYYGYNVQGVNGMIGASFSF